LFYLVAELESIRSLFNEKEKELAVSLAKVEALTRQLEELKNGINNQYNHVNSKVNIEINKLKQEILVRFFDLFLNCLNII
jgi:apoptosis stimulating of P53, putative